MVSRNARNMLHKTKLLLFLLFLVNTLYAQNNSNTLIPVDSALVRGELPNGFKYYLQQSKKPAKQVQFQMMVDAGSILETEEQRGFAHFVEHMVFNGSEHFPANTLIDFFQRVGVEFGSDINAYTGYDQTVYMLPLPYLDDEILDSALNFFGDIIGGGLEMNTEEIDSERKVIYEEWRTTIGLDERLKREMYPLLNYGSHYLHRMPIGLMEVVTQVGNDEELRKFYNSWYRPDLASLMVVGDFDIEEMRSHIEERFGAIQVSQDAPKRIRYTMPEHDQTLIKVIQDPEITSSSVRIVRKIEAPKKETLEDLKRDVIDIVYTYMLNQRLTDITQLQEAPFMYGSSFYQGGGIGGRDRYTSFASVKSGGVIEGMKGLLRELYRAKEYGFTQVEFDLKRESLASDMRRAAKEATEQSTSEIMNALSSHVIYGEEYMNPKFRSEFVLQTIEEMTLDDINALAKRYISKGDDNLVVIVSAPQSAPAPSEQEILEAMHQVAQERLEPYVTEMIDSELMTELPEMGEIIAESYSEQMGITVIEFANGASVALKPTTFMADEIRFSSMRNGGYSLAEDDNFDNASMAATLISAGGLGEFSSKQVDQINSGKQLYLSPYIHRYTEGVSGFSSADDFETLLQVNYLTHTSPRKDSLQFKIFVENKKEYNRNQLNDADSYYADGINRAMMQNSPRAATLLTPEQLDALDLEKAYEFYCSRFSSALGSRFFIVGSFEVDSIRPMLRRYIGSLPSHQTPTEYIDRSLHPAKGYQRFEFDRNSVYQSKVLMRFVGDYPSKQKSRIELNMLSDILTIRLTERLREEIGGAYSPYSRATTLQHPSESFRMDIYFTCSPENVDMLMEAALAEVETLKREISNEDLDKVKKAWLKNRKGSLESNGYWRKVMEDQWTRGEDEGDFNAYSSQIENTSAKELRKVAKRHLTRDKLKLFILSPQAGIAKQ